MKFVIYTFEYNRRETRVSKMENKTINEFNEEITRHQKKLTTLMDAKERRSTTRNGNDTLDKKIKYSMLQIRKNQGKIDHIKSNLKEFYAIYESDGSPITEDQLRSSLGTDALGDFGFLGTMPEPEVKQEPMEDVKQEIKEEIKQEPEDIASPNVIKTEPQ